MYTEFIYKTGTIAQIKSIMYCLGQAAIFTTTIIIKRRHSEENHANQNFSNGTSKFKEILYCSIFISNLRVRDKGYSHRMVVIALRDTRAAWGPTCYFASMQLARGVHNCFLHPCLRTRLALAPCSSREAAPARAGTAPCIHCQH